MAVKAVFVHVHVSDNREPLCGAEKSWLTVNVD